MLLVSYLESYLNDLQRRLIEWRIAIVSNSTAIILRVPDSALSSPNQLQSSGQNHSLSGG